MNNTFNYYPFIETASNPLGFSIILIGSGWSNVSLQDALQIIYHSDTEKPDLSIDCTAITGEKPDYCTNFNMSEILVKGSDNPVEESREATPGPGGDILSDDNDDNKPSKPNNNEESGGGISGGAIAGIVIGVVVVVAGVAVVLVYFLVIKPKSDAGEDNPNP